MLPTLTRLALLTALALAAFAATTTTVTATFKDAAGNSLSGNCTAVAVEPWSAAITGWRVVSAPVVITYTAGAFSASLVPTDTATPAGQYYQVKCTGRAVGGTAVTWGPVYWLVPTSSTPLDISQVETNIPPVPSILFLVSQLNVTNLANGTYCITVVGGVASLATCPGGGGNLSLAGLSNSQLTSLSDGQLSSMGN
jgi:hypothetical protein